MEMMSIYSSLGTMGDERTYDYAMKLSAKEVSKLVIECVEELGLALADYIEMPAVEAPTNWLLVDGNIEVSDVDARIFKTVREAIDFAEQYAPESETDCRYYLVLWNWICL